MTQPDATAVTPTIMHPTEIMLRTLITLARRHLDEANAARASDHDWPAGQTWEQLGHTSKQAFLQRACDEAGVSGDAVRTLLGDSPVDLDDIWRQSPSPAVRGPRAMDVLQREVGAWMRRAFGDRSADSRLERAARFVEEALELGQAAELTRDQVEQLVGYVFDRPVGELEQEVGGAAVTLLAFCHTHEISMRQLTERELDRVLAMPIEHFALRNAQKRAAGIYAASVSSTDASP